MNFRFPWNALGTGEGRSATPEDRFGWSAAFGLSAGPARSPFSDPGDLTAPAGDVYRARIAESAARAVDYVDLDPASTDTLTGTAADDRFVVVGAHAGERYDGVGGVDSLDVSGETRAYTAVLGLGAEFTINGAWFRNFTNIVGTRYGDTITGSAAANVIDGGGGIDSMTGGGGDDTYHVDDTLDMVVEAVGGGTDTVIAAASFTLAAGVENLTLVGSAAQDLAGTGNAGDNHIVGDDGDNRLDGAGFLPLGGNGGADTLEGGLGDDTYLIRGALSPDDVIVEEADAGTDTVVVAFGASFYTLGANLENLEMQGATGAGNELDNVITGGDFNNNIQGRGGDDTIRGGGGDDSLNGDGLSNDDDYTGADVIYGDAGNDSLNGRAGTDTLYGGAGDDQMMVDQSDDVAIEYANEGTDTVSSYVSYTLGDNIENLTLIALYRDYRHGTGNALDNVITGTVHFDRLDGGAGADTLIGRGDTDTFVVDNVGDVLVDDDSGDGDIVEASISWSLAGSNIESVKLVGAADDDLAATGRSGAEDTLTGDDGDNRLDGAGGGDVLSGGLGDDTLVDRDGGDVLSGGAGDDTYILGAAPASIDEAADGGVDTVRTAGDHTLGAGLENLVLTARTGVATGIGSDADNRMRGIGADKVFDGGAGKDTLSGDRGNDTLDGGDGDDRIQGGLGDDQLSGGAGADRLRGAAGADILDGGAGNDILCGETGTGRVRDGGPDAPDDGAGADVFVFAGNFGRDKVRDFGVGDDRLDFSAFAALNGGEAVGLDDLVVRQRSDRTMLQLDLDGDGAADRIDLDGDGTADIVGVTLKNVRADDLTADMFIL